MAGQQHFATEADAERGVVAALQRAADFASLVAAWLAGIIIDLVTLGDFYDVALRDFGLLVGALALAALAFDREKSVA